MSVRFWLWGMGGGFLLCGEVTVGFNLRFLLCLCHLASPPYWATVVFGGIFLDLGSFIRPE